MEEIFRISRILSDRFAKDLHRVQAETLAPYGLTARHAPYLLSLFEAEEGRTLSELSRAVLLDKANTTRVARELGARDFVRRGGCARGCRVMLTEQGRKVAGELLARVTEIRRAGLAALTEEERGALLGIMKKLAQS